MKLDRLLSIIVILLNRDRVSAKELAERFEVTVRTIYRDIDAINLSGIPIISYSGNNGGFGILENFKLDKHYLSMEEMTSILSALKGINKTLEDKTIDTTIEKIRSLVPESAKSDNYLSLNETIAIDILPWGATENIKEKLKIIKKAANERKTLTIKYFSSSEETSERIIEPMTLVLKGVSWYLFAFCKTKNDFRVFKLARIKSIKVNNQLFERKNRDYKEYFNNNYELEKNFTKLKLKFDIDSENLIYEYFDESSIISKNEKFIILEINYPLDKWIISWLLSFGDSVEI